LSGGRELIRARHHLLGPTRSLAGKLNSRVVRGTRVSTIVLKFKRATGELGTVLDRRGRAAVLKYLSDRDHLSRLRNEIRERYLAKGKDGEEYRGICGKRCWRRLHFRK